MPLLQQQGFAARPRKTARTQPAAEIQGSSATKKTTLLLVVGNAALLASTCAIKQGSAHPGHVNSSMQVNPIVPVTRTTASISVVAGAKAIDVT